MKKIIMLLTMVILTISVKSAYSQEEQPSSAVPKLRSGEEQPEYVKKVNIVTEQNLDDYFQLGKWAVSKKLYGPAKIYFQTILMINPNHSGAKEELSKGLTGDLPDRQAGLPPDYFTVVKECRAKFLKVQIDCAKRFVELALWCKENGRNKMYKNFIDTALKINDDNAEARTDMGQVNAYPFGWVKKDEAEKIKKGLLEFEGKWLPKAEVFKLRDKWETAWRLRSPHFALQTDMPLQKAQETLKDLEDFYEAFMNIFYGVDGFQIDFNVVFKVYYFKNIADFQKHGHKEYVDSIAYYINQVKAIFFREYDKKEVMTGNTVLTVQQNLHHECVHMFLAYGTDHKEEPPVTEYWVVEGLSTCFESFNHEKGAFTNKGRQSLLSHKQRILTGDFMDLNKFFRLTKDEFVPKNDNKTGIKNYGQACDLVLFLMQSEQYKLKFLEYILESYHYSGKTFEEIMGIKDLAKFKSEWLEFSKKEISKKR